MSFGFSKPKRNLRTRGNDDSDPDADDHESISNTEKPKKKSKPKKVNQPALSFQEEWNEGDDGEIFQVKKSSQSKKIRKLLDKERKKKKEVKNAGNGDHVEDVRPKKSHVTTDDDIVITVKNTLPILNGRDAEAAVEGGISSEEEDSSKMTGHHRFSRPPDSVRLMLQRGRIPDAATIHAARKQRQHVREMGDVVPAAEENRFDKPEQTSRLLRDDDDDNDGSDGEEERMKMTVSTIAEDRLRRKAEFDAAQEADDGDSEKEEEEWEAQQIRKGVTGAQIAAVQQETLFYQSYSSNNESNQPPSVLPTDVMAMGVDSGSAMFATLDAPSGPDQAHLVLAKMKLRLKEMKEVARRHRLECDNSRQEVIELKSECQKIVEEQERNGSRYRYYQDLRGYVTDLVECLDEKVVVIEMLEQRVENLYGKKTSDSVARRRQDVQDQAMELAPNKGKVERDEALIRRTAEREGRRIRRQRARELAGLMNHVEGMSSDEEVTVMEASTTKSQRDVIEQDAKLVFDDTLDDFATVEGILHKFNTWRETDMDSYSEAYVNLCLPKLLGPLLRVKLLFWNPLLPDAPEVEKLLWMKSLLLYGAPGPNQPEHELKADPDAQLLPRLIEKVVLPKLSRIVSTCWDPLSSSQTKALVNLITRLIQEYPTVSYSSKPLQQLMSQVLDRMKEAVENDVYIPIYPVQRFSEGKIANFFSRQCAVASKLLANLLRWCGLISDSTLAQVALDSLLNRYLVSAIRTCLPLQAANVSHMVSNALPRTWLQPQNTPEQLGPFLNQVKAVIQQLDPNRPQEKEAMERISNLLKSAMSA